ncbi:hypothetical protein OPU67_15740, partial [Erythrobacter sp. WG]|nr:hypothetical protein [Erythrobacter sp. WG]
LSTLLRARLRALAAYPGKAAPAGWILGSGASANTAVLWLKLLEERALIFTDDDPTDERRKLVRMTSEGYETMTRYLNDIIRMTSSDQRA